MKVTCKCLTEVSKLIPVSCQQQKWALYYLYDQIEKNEMGGACGMYGGEDRCIQSFRRETWEKETTWKYDWGGVWIDLAHDGN
jgi:hypothetical protein